MNIGLDHMLGLSIDPDIETQHDKKHMIANQQVNILHLDKRFLMSHHNFLQQNIEYKRVYHQLENIP